MLWQKVGLKAAFKRIYVTYYKNIIRQVVSEKSGSDIEFP